MATRVRALICGSFRSRLVTAVGEHSRRWESVSWVRLLHAETEVSVLSLIDGSRR